MNVQLVNSLVEVVLKLSPEEQRLFQEKLSNKDLTLQTSKPQTPEEKLLLWQEWIDKAPKSHANLSDEALRRENIYDSEI
jgi:hypothetical protein